MSPAVSSSLPAPVMPGDAALAAYRGMFDDWVAIAVTGDYQNPRLARHTSGRALSLIYKGVYKDRESGLHSQGHPEISPKITAMTPQGSPDRASVSDCVDTSSWLSYRSNGEVQSDPPGGRHSVQALALKKDGVWKIDQLVIQNVGTC